MRPVIGRFPVHGFGESSKSVPQPIIIIKPHCPWCNTNKHVRTSGTNLHAFYCGRCGREFEDVDDGDVGYGRPEKRMEREERRRLSCDT